MLITILPKCDRYRIRYSEVLANQHTKRAAQPHHKILKRI